MSTFFEVSSFTFMAVFVSRFGSETASAHQIVGNMTSMCYMIPLSIGIASSVLVSQCLGARWPALSYAVLKRSLRITAAIALCMSLVLFFLRGPIIWLYTKEAAVHALAASLILFGCLYHLFDALQCVSSFSLRGFRVTRVPMIIYGVMLWGVGLGLGYYFAFHGEWAGGPFGVYGFWGLTSVGLFLTGTTLCGMAVWVGRQFAKDDEHTPEEIAAALAHRA
ncbi:MATE domain protein [Sutterella parvirubra YIT 11816]|uniref:MATE domain protein n=2 Tax=Sutterella TaxID=40544 RepID=H3KCE8_9BURK|nr:MATE domain protein [Sutterella parvirubra YIT 11816]